MRLALKNFKCWENAEFDISENGITLLSGSSGCGKTSILQAIYFALYDKGTKLVRHGASSCRVEVEGFGMHIVRTKKPNRLVVDGRYEDETGQAMIDRKFGKNFNIVSYVEQDSFKSLVYMTPASRLEFMENFAFEGVDMERVKTNLRHMVRQSEDARLKAQAELEFRARNLGSLARPHCVPLPGLARPSPESAALNSQEMDRLIKEKADLQHGLAHAQARAREAATSEETRRRLRTEIAELERRIVDTNYCGDIEYNKLSDLLKRAVRVREYTETRKRYDEILGKYTSLRDEEERLHGIKTEQLRRGLWSGKTKEEALAALSDARRQDEMNKEHAELSLRVHALRGVADEYATLLPLSGVLATCPGCACSVSIVDGTTILLSDQRDETAVLRLSVLRPQYAEYTETCKRLSGLEYRAVDLAGLEAYFLENDSRERQLASLSTFSASPTLASIFREGKDLKRRLEQFADIDLELELDEPSLRDRLADEKCRKDVTEMLLSQIAAKRGQCPADVSENTHKDAIGDLQLRIAAVESRVSELYGISRTQLCLEKEWHEYDSFVSQEAAYAAALGCADQSRESLQRAELRYENVQRLREIVSLSESECLVNIVNTINIHAQQFIDAFFTSNPLSAQLATFKEAKSGQTKPQIDLKIEYKGQDADLSSLSGGERARLSLAFTLALAEIYNHPLLMLDESISSLDYDSTVDVVQAVKDALADKTVLVVSHQANTGIFDHVVEF